MDLEDLGSIRRIKLEQCVQLCQFENDANQVQKNSIKLAIFKKKWPNFVEISTIYFQKKWPNFVEISTI